MANCTFCDIKIPQGTEKIFVRNDGRLYFFCSSKCEKNLIKLNRIPREVRWTGDYKKFKGKSVTKNA